MLIPSKKCWMCCAITACRWRRSGHERFPFYDLVANVFAIAQTGELRPYGNFIFKKGVILGGALWTPAVLTHVLTLTTVKSH